MDMSTVSTADLKQQLSRYLHRAQAGEDVIVTSHHRPVARLTTFAVSPQRLALIPPRRPKNALLLLGRIALRKGCDPVALLLEDRARR
jgi:prevent-host-death family protein